MAYGAQAVDNPDAFVGRVTLSAYEPYPLVSGSSVSSVAASGVVARWIQPQPLYVKNIVMQASLNASVPGATSQASTGSEGWTYAQTANLFSRNGYGANSTQLAFVTSGSFGLSATLGYSSTSQAFGISYVTDTAGGTLNLTTSSADGGWSNFATGLKAFNLPFQATLTAGEYFMVFTGTSNAATSNSAVTLCSFSTLQVQGQFGNGAAAMSQSATNFTNYGPNMDCGLATSLTTNATMALSALTGGARIPWFAFSNA